MFPLKSFVVRIWYRSKGFIVHVHNTIYTWLNAAAIITFVGKVHVATI